MNKIKYNNERINETISGSYQTRNARLNVLLYN
jgi:hypothetical protein